MRILPLLFLVACAADPADVAPDADRARSDAELAGARPATEEDLAALIDRVEALEARNAAVNAALKASGLALTTTSAGEPCLAYYDAETGAWSCDEGDLAEMVADWRDRLGGVVHDDTWESHR